MLEKWKQWAIRMNFRKSAVFFLITSLVLIIASSAILYGNFRNRIAQWEQNVESDGKYEEKEKDFKGEHNQDSKERREKDWEWIQDRFDLSVGDLALVTGCGIIGMVVGIWYWLLIMIWVYRKSYHMGINSTLWVWAALLFNFAAVVALYFYSLWKGTCTNCGKITDRSKKFCDRCGSSLKKICPECGQEADRLSVYCGNCGKKLDENNE